MSAKIRRAGRFYSSVIMENIGVFMFIGLLSVIFNRNGWLPDEELYEISQFAYTTILPVCIAYSGGGRISGKPGGILAVLAVSGILCADTSLGLLSGMAAGPAAGFIWKYTWGFLEKKVPSSMQMLMRNLTAGVIGGGLAALGFYFLTPIFWAIERGIALFIHELLNRNLTGLLSLIIEPAKVFFLNNILNHGILVPLAMSELKTAESSVLFLLEANPGPGLGMLTALYFYEKKEKYLSALVAHGAGGIHEVYFPFVLSDLWLLLPLVVSGVTGAVWFDIFNAGLNAPVSPGSIVTILIMAGKKNVIFVFLGILLSAAVSFGGSILVLVWQKGRNAEKKVPDMEISGERMGNNFQNLEEKTEEEQVKMPINKIGFVCDAGVGSSAMGAAIFRRKLHQNNIEGIEVQPYAADSISGKLDLIVCQKDFFQLLPQEQKEQEIFTVDNFVSAQAYDELVRLVEERRGL